MKKNKPSVQIEKLEDDWYRITVSHCGDNQTIIEGKGSSLFNQTEYLQCSDCKKYFRLRISISEIKKIN